MTRDHIADAVGYIADRHIEETTEYNATKKSPAWIKWGVLAACLCLCLGATLFFLPGAQDDKVTVTYGNWMIPKVQRENCLVYFSEEEMFANEAMYIFRGKVTDLKNVTLNFAGSKEYRCVAEISIEEVYQGEITAGETIKMLLPCPIMGQILTSDSETVSQMAVGMEGIFMPWVYDEHSYFEENGVSLLLSELAPCGLADGVRWVFLEDSDGLIFSEDAYPNAVGATTLDEIEIYIEEQLHARTQATE